MTDLFLHTSSRPHDIAVTSGQGSVTWQQLESRSKRVANSLASSGLLPGDRWAILAHNCLEWAELILGNVWAGTRYVPLNWHLTVGELEYLLKNSGARALFVDQQNAQKGTEAALLVGIEPHNIFVFADNYEKWRDACLDHDPLNTIAGSPLLYTGGTTGASKGVVRPGTGAPVHKWASGNATWGHFVHMPTSGVALITTPMYHGFGTGVLGAALSREHSVILHDRFDAINFLNTIEAERVTSAPLVPTLIVRLAKLDQSEFTSRDLSCLQWIVHTAAPCPSWAKQRLIDMVGPIVVEFYGSSEGTGPVVCTSQEWIDKPGTVGRPAPHLQISVVDDNGADVTPMEIGTLYFARSDGAPRYFGDPQKTAASRLPDGRFTVGDLGYLDADGFMYLVDRRTDLILNGGANVYPAEIEAVISQHPSVADVAVFGIPDPEFGQQVKAAIQCEQNMQLTEAEIIEWCRVRLASFKCPRSIDFHDALPREAHGKLKKRLLRDAYWEN